MRTVMIALISLTRPTPKALMMSPIERPPKSAVAGTDPTQRKNKANRGTKRAVRRVMLTGKCTEMRSTKETG